MKHKGGMKGARGAMDETQGGMKRARGAMDETQGGNEGGSRGNG